MGCPPSGACSGGHPTSTTLSHLTLTLTTRLAQTLHSPSCQCRLCPKAGGKRAPGPEDRGWKKKGDETENRHSSINLVEDYVQGQVIPVWIEHVLGGLGRIPLLKRNHIDVQNSYIYIYRKS